MLRKQHYLSDVEICLESLLNFSDDKTGEIENNWTTTEEQLLKSDPTENLNYSRR